MRFLRLSAALCIVGALVVAQSVKGSGRSALGGSDASSQEGSRRGLLNNELFRVWVQYKGGTSHNKALHSLKSVVVDTLDAPEAQAQQWLRPDKDRPSNQLVVPSSPFRVHYDFFDHGLSSIAMTVNWDVLEAIKKDPSVAHVTKDPKRYPLQRVTRKSRRMRGVSVQPKTAYDSAVSDKVSPPMVRRIQASNSTSNSTTTNNTIPFVNETIPYGVRLVEADLAWALGFRGKGIKVCLIDTGLDVSHPEYVTLTNWSGRSTEAGPWYQDGDGHGTHVTGIVAARANGFGVVGVAPRADVFTVRVFDNTGYWVYASSLVDAVLICKKNGAKVINMSLSGDKFNAVENTTFTNLRQQGIVAVAAAGNDGTATYRYPASYPSVVSVGAVDASKVVGWFSQRNDQVTVVAPGVDVLSTVPGGKYERWMGTSMAAPHVAGVVALLFSKNVSATGNAIVRALTTTAQDLGKVGYDKLYGNGLVSAKRALAKI